MTDPELYVGREQTLVKHSILRKYLERFAHIVCSVGSRWDTLTYVDCFSGPWNEQSEKFEDSSFAIALNELRKARETHAGSGKKVGIRCFFLEKSASAYAKLKVFSDQITDAEVVVQNAAFEDSIAEILAFVKRGRKSFPFFFIDPTGWTGFSMRTIAPLLSQNPGEVLINFMMGHILRFLDSPQGNTQESFMELFGSLDYKARIQGLTGRDREDAIVEAYMQSVRVTGGFSRTCNAIVLHPEKDRTHFNLIYATRSPRGVEVFKEAEKKAMEVQERVRAEAEVRRRVETTGQQELLGSEGPHDARYFNGLRERYLSKSKGIVIEALKAKTRLVYDDALALIDSVPMTWESDLKLWISKWREEGVLEVNGMKPRQRVPKRGEKNILVWEKE